MIERSSLPTALRPLWVAVRCGARHPALAAVIRIRIAAQMQGPMGAQTLQHRLSAIAAHRSLMQKRLTALLPWERGHSVGTGGGSLCTMSQRMSQRCRQRTSQRCLRCIAPALPCRTQIPRVKKRLLCSKCWWRGHVVSLRAVLVRCWSAASHVGLLNALGWPHAAALLHSCVHLLT